MRTTSATRRAVIQAAAAAAGSVLLPSPLRSAGGRAALVLPQAGVHLLMIDDLGCPYCARWDAEVGVGYARSPEGAFAPLLRTRRGDAALAGLRPITHTPTFVVLRDGKELDRITGYPGAHFFWPLLDAILARAGFVPVAASQ